MGIPCVNSRCSTEPSVDGSGRLNIDVRLDPEGSIECTEGLGLGVKLHPDAENILTSDVNGLSALRTQHQIAFGLPGGVTEKTWTDGVTTNPITTTISNPSATRDILAIVHIKWQYTANVLAKEWWVDGTFNTQLSIGADVSESFSIGGAGDSALTDAKVHAAHATVFRTIPASSSLVLTSTGTGKTSGTADGSGGAGGSMNTQRFIAFYDVVILDSHAVSGLASIS